MRCAIYLDRDGTIFEDSHYPRDPRQVALIPNAAQGLRLMKSKGYLLFVVSNQSGVARGIITQAAFEAVHDRCLELLRAEGVEISHFGYCLHAPDAGCGCRKPAPGLAPRFHEGVPVDMEKSFTVGDKECDLGLAEALGTVGYLVLTGYGRKTLTTLDRSGRRGKIHVCEHLLVMAEALPVAV